MQGAAGERPAGRHRLGGSALAQVYGQLGGEPADLDAPQRLVRLAAALAELRERGMLRAYHDRSDGGLLVTLLEMAFAGHCGLDIALPAEGVFHNLVFVSIKKTYPMQAYKIMHGLWGMGQMMFTKYIVIVDDDVDVHNTSDVLFRLCANTDPQRDSIFTKGPADVLDHATSEMAIGSKLGIDATKKLPGEGFKRPWPPLIKMDEAVRKKMDALFNASNKK